MSFLAKTGLVLANVKDFGAKGDGAADDTVAIQVAIDDAIASGTGGIFFPAGDYRVSLIGLTISAVTGFRITGVGWGAATLQFIAESHASTARQLIRLSGGCSFIKIDNLTFDGNKAGITNPSTSTSLLSVVDTTDLEVTSCVIQNSTGHGVTMGDTGVTPVGRINLHALRVFDNNGRGFNIDTASEVFIERNTIEFLVPAAEFVYVDGGQDHVIRNNIMNANTGGGWNGVRVVSTSNCVITNNIIRGGLGNLCIFVTASVAGVDNLSIEQNQLIANTSNSIEFVPTSGDIGRFSIQDNEISAGIRFLSGVSAYTAQPIVSGNWGASAAFFLGDLANFPQSAIVVGGALWQGSATENGATQYLGTGTPEGNISGFIGDTFQRVDGSPGSTFYVKESGAGTNTGWVANAVQKGTAGPLALGSTAGLLGVTGDITSALAVIVGSGINEVVVVFPDLGSIPVVSLSLESIVDPALDNNILPPVFFSLTQTGLTIRLEASPFGTRVLRIHLVLNYSN